MTTFNCNNAVPCILQATIVIPRRSIGRLSQLNSNWLKLESSKWKKFLHYISFLLLIFDGETYSRAQICWFVNELSKIFVQMSTKSRLSTWTRKQIPSQIGSLHAEIEPAQMILELLNGSLFPHCQTGGRKLELWERRCPCRGWWGWQCRRASSSSWWCWTWCRGRARHSRCKTLRSWTQTKFIAHLREGLSIPFLQIIIAYIFIESITCTYSSVCYIFLKAKNKWTSCPKWKAGVCRYYRNLKLSFFYRCHHCYKNFYRLKKGQLLLSK